MLISLIAAFDHNRVIGKNAKIPWKISSDMKRFKSLTTGKVIIMGRKTFESIGSKPLPERVNIVVTTSKEIEDRYIMMQPSLLTVTNIESAIHLATTLSCSKVNATNIEPEIMVIGGTSIYRDCLPFATKMYLTRIHAEIIDDAFNDIAYFPEFNEKEWNITHQEDKVESGIIESILMDIGFTFQTIERNKRQ